MDLHFAALARTTLELLGMAIGEILNRYLGESLGISSLGNFPGDDVILRFDGDQTGELDGIRLRRNGADTD
jgi:hypothetical protein